MTLGAVDSSFETFGRPHVAAMVLTAAAAVGLTVWARKAGSPKPARAIRWTIAVGLLLNELVYYACGLATAPVEEFLRGYLPIHICGAAVFLTAWTLWRPNRYVYEIAYFWGLAGTSQAILTPNLPVDFPSYRFFEYFITHGGIVVGVVFATWGMGLRPARGAVLRVFVITNVYTLIVAGVNRLLGANYMFLREPPVGETPFFFLPWPWYILFLELVGLGFVLLLCLPFAIGDRLGNAGSGKRGVSYAEPETER